MELANLKQGDVFYDVTINNITKYEYLMLYPFHNPNNVNKKGYHIILNKSLDEPVPVYYDKIVKILELKCFTYEDAKAKQIQLVEEYLNFLKSE